MGKIEENKLLKKNKLMSAAYELFTTKGITATSIADITEKSGIGKGTFYQYFKDKYDLKEKLVASRAEVLFNHAIEHSGYDQYRAVDDKIIAIMNDILNQLSENKIWLRFISKNLSYGVFKESIETDYSPYFDFFQKLLECEDRKKVSILIYTVVEFIGSTCYRVILYDDPVALAEYQPYLDRYVRLILNDFMKEEK